MRKFVTRSLTRTELLVTSVLLLQFMTYIFGIFGNPIKAGFELGRKVESLQLQLTNHCISDSSWKQLINLRFDVNASDHAVIKYDMQQIKKAVIRPNPRASKE